MNLIDAQNYLAAAYTTGRQGAFHFQDLPEGLRGRTRFQQAVQELNYVVPCPGGWKWLASAGFPTPEMQADCLAKYKELQKACKAREAKAKEAKAQEPVLDLEPDEAGMPDETTPSPTKDDLAQQGRRFQQLIDEFTHLQNLIQGLYSANGRSVANQVEFAKAMNVEIEWTSLRGESKHTKDKE